MTEGCSPRYRLMGFYAPDEELVLNLNKLCAVSAIDVLKPAIFVFLGIITPLPDGTL